MILICVSSDDAAPDPGQTRASPLEINSTLPRRRQWGIGNDWTARAQPDGTRPGLPREIAAHL